MKHYGYIRVSSDKQTVENQKFSIIEYCKAKNIKVNDWIEETISSRKKLDKRQLGQLLNQLETGDVIIITEISRLARNLYEIAGILQLAIDKEVEIISIKENYCFRNDIQSKIMAYTFGLAAEIERNLISLRTKQSLDKLKQQNIKLGRPFGKESRKLKLSKNKNKVIELLNKGTPKAHIARIMNVNKTTLFRFLKRNNIVKQA